MVSFLGKDISCNVPMASMYNEDTVMSENGNLVKVLEFGFARYSDNFVSKVQSLIGELLYDNQSPCIAVWLSTVRVPFAPADSNRITATDPISLRLSKGYAFNFLPSKQFENKLYISLVSRSFLGVSKYKGDFRFKSLQDKVETFSASVEKSLKNFCSSAITKLVDYSPHLMDGKGMLDFFSTIMGVEPHGLNPGIKDIAYQVLSDCSVVFGFNTFEIVESGQKKFGTSFRVKGIGNHTVGDLTGKLLSVSGQIVVTEIINPVSFSRVNSDFGDLCDLAEAVHDQDYIELSGRKEILELLKSKKADAFCERSFNVTIFADKLEELEELLRLCSDIFTTFGFLIVRNDLLLEDSYWEKFPANFLCTRKSEITQITNCASFACTHTHFRSKEDVSIGYVTQFTTMCDNVHNFNFYLDGQPKSATLLSRDDMYRSAWYNFIMLESMLKNSSGFMVLETERLSEVMIRALEKDYINLEVQEGKYKFNIFSSSNAEFLGGVLARLSDIEDDDERIKNAVASILKLSPEKRTLENCADVIDALNVDIKILNTKFAYLFSEEDHSIETDFIGTSAEGLIDHPNVAAAFGFYMCSNYVERVKESKPFIMVIDSPEKYRGLFMSLKQWECFLDRVAAKGGLVVISSASAEYMNFIHNGLGRKLGARILMSNADKFDPDCISVFNLPNSKKRELNDFAVRERCFLLEKGGNSIVLKFSPFSVKELNVLSSKGKIEIMQDAMRVGGNNPALWLERFYGTFQ